MSTKASSRWHLISVFILTGSLWFLASCTRSTNDSSNGPMARITIATPSQSLSAQGTAFPANRKACYGIHIKGPGIPTSQANSCAPVVGTLIGFVAEGGTLNATVPKGSDRTFELYVYLADPTEACPTLDLGFTGEPLNGRKTYLSGTTTGVNLTKDDESVAITLNFPGEGNSVAVSNQSTTPTSCQVVQPGSLKASLYSNGDIIDAGTGNNLTALSHPLNSDFYLTSFSDLLGVGMVSSGGILNFLGTTQHQIPMEVFSVTRKPDTGKFYGLLYSGQVVELTLNGSATTYSELNGTTCPFEVANCQVPVWLQSISAGYGRQIFGLDHGGTVYNLLASGPEATSTQVSPIVTQVSFY